jgi:hypothetical protein
MHHLTLLPDQTTPQTLQWSRLPPRLTPAVDPQVVTVSANLIARPTCESEASRQNLMPFIEL